MKRGGAVGWSRQVGFFGKDEAQGFSQVEEEGVVEDDQAAGFRLGFQIFVLGYEEGRRRVLMGSWKMVDLLVFQVRGSFRVLGVREIKKGRQIELGLIGP